MLRKTHLEFRKEGSENPDFPWLLRGKEKGEKGEVFFAMSGWVVMFENDSSPRCLLVPSNLCPKAARPVPIPTTLSYASSNADTE